ncbi:MAG: MBL fold metallo-hydrolase [Pseudomonadota bacterium]
MKLRFLGSGDAFGSGGRFNTCFLVDASGMRFLIDCGASSMIAMRKFDVDPNSIDAVLITHLHGDHFGGLVFMLMDAQLVSKRDRPLRIVGPKTLAKRLSDTMECLFPGSTGMTWRYEVTIDSFEDGLPWHHDGLAVTPFRVKHFCGAPPYAVRAEIGGKTVTYTGDTEWVDALVPAGRDADLFIAEAYYRDKQMKFHLNFETLMSHLDEIRPKRLVLTHMSDDMLASPPALPTGIAVDVAEDGLELTV